MKTEILIVDDSLTARQNIINYIGFLPVLIHEATNGEEGLEKVSRFPQIRLVLTDINMPKMSGLDFIRTLKTLDAGKHIAVCFLTTESGTNALETAKMLGADAFLVKPIQKDQILALMNGFLRA